MPALSPARGHVRGYPAGVCFVLGRGREGLEFGVLPGGAGAGDVGLPEG